MIFKYLLAICLSSFLVYVLLLPKQNTLRKVFFLSFVSLMLTFSLYPDLSTRIANYFGIVRGVDMLFYLSHLFLLFIAFVYYLKFKDLEIKLARLVRNMAINEAMHSK